MLSSTAEEYLEPILSTISNKLKFSESLAGVTLVALANGAPDVFAAFAAAGDSGSGGITLSVGSLFGAGCFVSSVVLAGVLLSARGGRIQVESSALIRDCAFYFIGTAWILILGIVGEIGMVGVIGLFVNYFVFIGIVIHQELKYKKEEQRREQEEQEIRARNPSFMVNFTEHYMPPSNYDKVEPIMESINETRDEDEGEDEEREKEKQEEKQEEEPEEQTVKMNTKLNLSTLLKNQYIVYTKPEEKMTSFDIAKPGSSAAEKRKAFKRQGTHSYTVRTKFHFHVLRHKMWNELNELQESTFIGKILSLCKAPFNILRNFTIPSSTEEKWNKAILLVQPLTTSVFCLWQFGWLDDVLETRPRRILYIVTVIACVFALWRTTHTKKVPQGLFGFFLLVLGFMTCIVWINFVANVFVDFIHLLSVMSGLPGNYLGLTVLAWGNSMNDLFVDSALARKGLGQVAISGVFAGQFFNLSIGFGISLIRQTLSSPTGSVSFDLLGKDPSNVNLVSMILICCLLLNIFSTIVYGAVSKYELKKGYGVYLVSCYLGFFVAATLLIMVFKGEA